MGSADGRLWISFNGEIYNYVESVPSSRRWATHSAPVAILKCFAAFAEWVADVPAWWACLPSRSWNCGIAA